MAVKVRRELGRETGVASLQDIQKLFNKDTEAPFQVSYRLVTAADTVEANDTIVKVVTADDLDIQLPKITASNDGRVLILKIDVDSATVGLSPNATDQVNAAGVDTDYDVSTDSTVVLVADFGAATAPNWEIVLSV